LWCAPHSFEAPLEKRSGRDECFKSLFFNTYEDDGSAKIQA